MKNGLLAIFSLISIQIVHILAEDTHNLQKKLARCFILERYSNVINLNPLNNL